MATNALGKSIAYTLFFDETLEVGRRSATGRTFQRLTAARALSAQYIARTAADIIQAIVLKEKKK